MPVLEKLAAPWMERRVPGEVVPMPTLPEVSIVILGVGLKLLPLVNPESVSNSNFPLMFNIPDAVVALAIQADPDQSASNLICSLPAE